MPTKLPCRLRDTVPPIICRGQTEGIQLLRRTVLIFDVGYGLGTNKSGGTTRLIEVMRRLPTDEFMLHFVTSVGGKKAYASEKFYPTTTVLASSLFFSVERYKLQRIISNAVSFLHSLITLPSLPRSDIVYSSSDYFFDVAPAVLTKIYTKGKYFAFVHHLCHRPMGRKGSFLINLISYISQRISFVLIKKFADKVFVYDTPEGDQIAQLLTSKQTTVHKVSNGVDLSLISAIERTEIRWDACFAGGLRETKGIFDVVRVWRLVVDKLPTAQLIIMGSGSQEVVSDLKLSIEEHNLVKNVTLSGHMTAPALIKNMKNSKIFVSTSHEEGWGISICEAIACGLTVHAYSLPAFTKFAKFINQVDKFDERALANRILNSLSKKEPGKNKNIAEITRLKEFEDMVNWDRIAASEAEIFSQ